MADMESLPHCLFRMTNLQIWRHEQEKTGTPVKNSSSMDGDVEKQCNSSETTVWIRCDVYDKGIGIPDKAKSTLFKKYMQASTDHARKYGGTGLGLAICKQLVELMGGRLTVTSKEHCGSTFTFLLPYKVSLKKEPQDDPDELSDMEEHEDLSDANNDDTVDCFFNFRPRTLGSLFSGSGSTESQKHPPKKCVYDPLNKLKNLSDKPYSFSISRETESDACSVLCGVDPFSDTESPRHDLKHDEVNAVHVDNSCESNSNSTQNSIAESCHYRKTCMEDDQKNKPRNSQDACHKQENENRSVQIQSNSNAELLKPKPRILLVEDNKINVMVAKSMMKQLGHDIVVVNNGVEAVRAVHNHRYDLVLMDVCMPVMDGLQATRLIRSFEETGSWDAVVKAGVDLFNHSTPSTENGLHTLVSSRQRVPIIAMTANALSESAEECLANGMDSFVSKSVTLQ